MNASAIPHSRIVRTQTLFMEGAPLTRREPQRSRTGGMYSHPLTIAGLLAWQALWVEQGRLYTEGPVVMEIYVRVARPPSHLSKSGLPNATGRSYPIPPSFDLSNVVKLVEDALKHHAFGDDSLIGGLHAAKAWAVTRRPAGVEVAISGMA